MESQETSVPKYIKNPLLENMNRENRKREGILNKQLDNNNNQKPQTEMTDCCCWCNLGGCCFYLFGY
jgi:hypothetical protein